MTKSTYDAWEITHDIDVCSARLKDLHNRRAEQLRVLEDIEEEIREAASKLHENQEEFRVRYLGLTPT